MARKKQRIDTSGQGSDGFSTLGGALAGLGFASSGAEPADEPAPSEPEETVDVNDLSTVRKVVLRLEKKGRRGKAVTLVQSLPQALLEPLAGELKRRLGCGVSVEDDALVVQGDQRDRVEALLRERGVKRLSR